MKELSYQLQVLDNKGTVKISRSREEITNTVLFLVSEDAKYIKEQIVGVDRGLTALAG